MGIRHKSLIIEGVQFHPESIASEKGDSLFKAFLNYSRENISHVLILNQLIDKKQPLSRQQTASFISELTDGTMDEKIASAVLTAMASRGLPTAEEMSGAAMVMLVKKTKFPLSNPKPCFYKRSRETRGRRSTKPQNQHGFNAFP